MREFFLSWHNVNWSLGSSGFSILGSIKPQIQIYDNEDGKIVVSTKPHVNPSIGLLLCKTKNDAAVEYALSRNMSPALVAEYQTRLIDKGILKNLLHEWYENIESPEDE
jgi:hypothetical protein